MTTKHIFLIIQRKWKIFFLILTMLIGVILIYPVVRFFPMLIHTASGFLSQNEKLCLSKINVPHTSENENQTYIFFLPLIENNANSFENRSQNIKALDKFHLIDTSPDGGQIIIQITTTENLVHSESMVEIAFLPGEQCNFGDGKACVYGFSIDNNNKAIISSVHSGMNGEGEMFRNLVEGTGINQALYTTDQVTKNIQSLIGSQVIIKQGDMEITELALAAIVRIPPNEIETYLALPIEQTLAFAIEITGMSEELLSQDLFIIETCGWRLPDEDQNLNSPHTMSSIYLGIIH